MSIPEKREIINHLSQEYPKKEICELLECPRSSYYYNYKEEDVDIKNAINLVLEEFPTYGYRRVTKQLQRQGWEINHKKISRLMKEMDLSQEVKRKKKRTTNSKHGHERFPNLVQGIEVSTIDQVWVSDLTFVRFEEDFIYLAIIMDVYTRAIRGWNLSRSIDGELTLSALKEALDARIPKIHHSDQGVQYAAEEYVKLLKKHKVKISMAEIGKAWQNGYCERIVKTIKEEEIYLSEYQSFSDAYKNIGHFLENVYMRKRIHSSLGYLTPSEFENKYLRKKNRPKFIYK